MNENQLYSFLEQVNKELFLHIGNYIDRIRLVALGSGIPPTEFTFELKVKSISGIQPDFRPIERDRWLLKIRLPRRAEGLPECEFLARDGMVRPFHPHVKPSFPGNGGYWKEYKTQATKEALLDLVLRICNSLQFDPNFIDTNIPEKSIGNEKAMNWFKATYEQSPNTFPWDKNTVIPIRLVRSTYVFEPSPQPVQETVAKREEAVQQVSDPLPPIEDGDRMIRKEEALTPPRKKFSISLAAEPYRPKRAEKPNLHIENELNSDVRGTTMNDELYVLHSAREDLFNHIDWTAKSPENLVEQGGLLIGEVYFDVKKKSHTGIVERAVSAKSAQSSATHLSLSHSVWREMTERIDKEMPGKQIIGWYHTHPNKLDVYMSEADLNTQRMMFPNDWQFAIILNPHRRIWRAFVGYEGRECHGFFAKSQEEKTENTSQQDMLLPVENTTDIINTADDVDTETSNKDL